MTSIDIHRGKMLVEKKGFLEKFFSFISMEGEHFRKTGKFKGTIEILPTLIIKEVNKLKLAPKTKLDLDLNYDPQNWGNSLLQKEIIRSEKVNIIVYILKA